ncbi:hypothetical protein PINS_up004974 [Pythium insidiosum]|nr:hypothetical protein PINS_up004974 [Pythium insidiosum]
MRADCVSHLRGPQGLQRLAREVATRERLDARRGLELTQLSVTTVAHASPALLNCRCGDVQNSIIVIIILFIAVFFVHSITASCSPLATSSVSTERRLNGARRETAHASRRGARERCEMPPDRALHDAGGDISTDARRLQQQSRLAAAHERLDLDRAKLVQKALFLLQLQRDNERRDETTVVPF